MARFYVRSVPFAGDLPYLEIGVGETTVFLVSRKTRTFDVYTQFTPRLSRKQQNDTGIRKQPAWAFMLSNGHDQAHLHWNAGEPSFTVMCKGSETNVSIRLGEADAHAMALSL